jgi:hypothetical protein
MMLLATHREASFGEFLASNQHRLDLGLLHRFWTPACWIAMLPGRAGCRRTGQTSLLKFRRKLRAGDPFYISKLS